MPSNDFYNHGSVPQNNTPGDAQEISAEFDSIQSGFAKLPTMTANSSKVVRVNAGATGLETVAPDALVAGTTHAATSKTTPVDADELPISDSAASWVLKKLTFANLWAWIQSKLASPGDIGGTTPAAGTFTTVNGTTVNGTTVNATGPINTARGTVAMHATTMDLWAQPNIIDATGSAVTITAIANAPQAGAERTLYVPAGTVITNNAMFAVEGGANYTSLAGDAFVFEAKTTNTYNVWLKLASAEFGDNIEYADTSTIVGFSSFYAKSITYKRISRNAYLVRFLLAGPSDSTETSFTLPFSSGVQVIFPSFQVTDNSVAIQTACMNNVSGTTVFLTASSRGGSWTASGLKETRGSFVTATF